MSMKTTDTAVFATDLNPLGRLTDIILNIPFPASCIFCNRDMSVLTTLRVCNDCRDKLVPLPEKHCSKCAVTMDIQFGNELCPKCQKNDYSFERILSPFSYDGIIRIPILKLKFGGRIDYAKTMAMLMKKELDDIDFDLIIPVPISRQRKMERKYNQSELMAKYLSGLTKKPCVSNILIKTRENPRQSSLRLNERILNVKGVYSVKNLHKIKNKTVLLIDDVTTTRYTLAECSRVLKKNHASKIICLVFASNSI